MSNFRAELVFDKLDNSKIIKSLNLSPHPHRETDNNDQLIVDDFSSSFNFVDTKKYN